MSKTNNNVITKNYSGKFGDQVVFRNRFGRSIMAKPQKKSTVPRSIVQLENQHSFAHAVAYAKSVIADPALKAKYAKKVLPGRTVYNLAISYFMKGKSIDDIDIPTQTEDAGDKIAVKAREVSEVSNVSVKSMETYVTVMEGGYRVPGNISRYWEYTGTTVRGIFPGLL
jgi:hypothetical protein